MSLSASMPITGFNILVGNNRLTPVQILCELGGSFLFIRKVVHSVLNFLINKKRSARMRPDADSVLTFLLRINKEKEILSIYNMKKVLSELFL